jgi:hypothetical protein
VTEVVEYLPSKHKVLNSNPNTTPKFFKSTKATRDNERPITIFKKEKKTKRQKQKKEDQEAIPDWRRPRTQQKAAPCS